MLRGIAVTVAALAIASGSATTASAAPNLYGLTADEQLVGLDAAAPGVLTAGPVNVAGGWERESLIGLVSAKVHNDLFAYDRQMRAYQVMDETTGAAMRSGWPWNGLQQGTVFSMTAAVPAQEHGGGYVVSNGGQVVLFNPGSDGGGTQGTATIAPSGATASLIANAVTSLEPAGHFAIDDQRDVLLRRESGTSFTTVGPLGIDIVAPSALAVLGDGTSLLAASTADGASRLYRLNRGTGAATLVGDLPSGVRLKSLLQMPPPTVRMAGTLNAMPIEEGRPLVFPLYRRGDPDSELVFQVTITRDPRGFAMVHAEPGIDYEPATHLVRFAPGQRTANIPITIHDDDLPERGENFAAIVESRSPASKPDHQVVPIHVHDYDAEFEQPTVTVDEVAGEALFTITRPGAHHGASSVAFATSGGTGTPGIDYLPVEGTLRFGGGERSKTVAVPLLRDAEAEATETVGIALRAPPGVRALSARTSSTLEIVDSPAGLPAATGPAATLGGRLALARRRNRLGTPLPVSVTCSAECRGTVELRVAVRLARRRGVAAVLSRARIAVTRPGRARAVLRLTRTERRRLRRAAPLRATVTASVRGATGAFTRTSRVTLVR